MFEIIHPKNLYMVRMNGMNYVVKAKEEDLEKLYNEDKITEYDVLTAYKLNKRR